MKSITRTQKTSGLFAAAVATAFAVILTMGFGLVAMQVQAQTTYDYPSTNEDNRNSTAPEPAVNGEQGPHVNEVSTGVGEVELEFVNPQSYLECFEYRIDGNSDDQSITAHDQTVGDNHPIVTGDEVYPQVCLEGDDGEDSPLTHTFENVEGEVEVRLAIGAERDWDFDWVTFEADEPVDYCDASQRPDGMSIADWHEENNFDGSSCFEYDVTQQCGSLDVQFTQNDTDFDYEFRYVIGTTTPALGDWEGDGELPVNFDEDEHNGSVDVTYYAVGPERDYFEGSDTPNIWDGNGETVTVSTDCDDDDEQIGQCEAVSLEIVSDENTLAGEGNATSTYQPEAWDAADSGDFDGADWIWESEFVDDPEATTTVTFTREFTYSGNSATSAELHIATDNGYEVELNGNNVGATSSQNNYASTTYDTYDVSGDVQTGNNTLTIEVTNYGQEGETSESNPAGLLYNLTIDGDACEEDDDDEDTTPPSDGGGGGGGALAPGGGGDVAGAQDDDDDDDDDDRDGQVLGAQDDDDDDVMTDEEISAALRQMRAQLLNLLGVLDNRQVGFPNTGDGSITDRIFGQ